MRSTDEVTWARALYNRKLKDEKSSLLFSGLLDAPLHSWVAKPYNSVAAAGQNRILIRAYELIRESELVIKSRKPTLSEVDIILETLRRHSKDELMWARFLYKLKQDTTVNVVVSEVFDILLQTKKSAHTPSVCIAALTGPSFSSKVGLMDLNARSKDELMWAKLLDMLGSSENEQANSLYNKLLDRLLEKWHFKNRYTVNAIDRYLGGSNFGMMIEYAKFSSDNPSATLLNHLQEQFGNELNFASQVQNSENLKGNRDVVLCAFFQSWIGKPFNADVNSEEFLRLKTAFDILENSKGRLQREKLDDKDTAFPPLLKTLFHISNDEFMWYRFLRKLQNDTSFRVPVADLVQFLRNIWQHKLSNTAI
ncbi:uncharacterized protein PHALS_11127 [Plasmopara halstedii]|uniref:Uncharacterized protein n=1 Tax=Plasmopara halstedii TaxID=4781 RepID=A0A0P1AK36_PLAHL|nr:uncharacterized protein PHALS_11127 [Plasmopara halstedii]CEG40954.1 hypothetical protein PHALS_11127 [Plasmopara halstedii]|eukprot:XP_024577323.1 hypothetical protein PHALS_11127 [Plasmopara halstedii]